VARCIDEAAASLRKARSGFANDHHGRAEPRAGPARTTAGVADETVLAAPFTLARRPTADRRSTLAVMQLTTHGEPHAVIATPGELRSHPESLGNKKP